MDSESTTTGAQMKETLAALADKLQRLDHQLSGKVNSVKDSLEVMRDACDLKKHVRKRPWTFVGSAAALGFIAGARASSGKTQVGARAATTKINASERGEVNKSDGGTKGACAASFTGPVAASRLSGLIEKFEPEILELKGIAIGMMMGLIRESISNRMHARAVPPVGRHRSNGR